jgi:hypothetical protein
LIVNKRKEKTKHQWLAPVILTPSKAEIGRITDPGQAGKKSARPHLNQYLGIMVYTHHPSYTEG